MELQPHDTKDAVARTDKRPTRRGRRQRKEVAWESVMVNPSSLPQLMDVGGKATMRKGSAVAIINQEHHRDKTQFADMQAMLRKAHWKMAAATAVEGARGGNSAKVAMLAPTRVGCGQISPKADISAGFEGSIAMAWAQHVVTCGFVITSAYSHSCQGPSPRNVKLLSLQTANCKGQRAPMENRSRLPR